MSQKTFHLPSEINVRSMNGHYKEALGNIWSSEGQKSAADSITETYEKILIPSTKEMLVRIKGMEDMISAKLSSERTDPPSDLERHCWSDFMSQQTRLLVARQAAIAYVWYLRGRTKDEELMAEDVQSQLSGYGKEIESQCKEVMRITLRVGSLFEGKGGKGAQPPV